MSGHFSGVAPNFSQECRYVANNPKTFKYLFVFKKTGCCFFSCEDIGIVKY